jgi:hypothetical protein
MPMKMSAPRNINVKSSFKESNCYITGLAVSPPNEIFAADYLNKSIKMIDSNSGAIKQLLLEP